MGGDHAPQAVLQGCWDAAPLLDDGDTIFLVGNAEVAAAGLEASGLEAEKRKIYRVAPAADVIGMDESPVEAVRAKPQSSINVMCKLASDGQADVVISPRKNGGGGGAAARRVQGGGGGRRERAGDRGGDSNLQRPGRAVRRRRQSIAQAAAHETIRDDGRFVCLGCLRHRESARRAI